MNKKWMLFTACASLFSLGMLQAEVICFGPSITFTAQQPVRAIIVDGDGNTIEKTYVYNPDLGGIDIGVYSTPYASIYFPDSNVRYLYAGGFWVGEDGYYWNHGRRYYYDHPGWGAHWNGYWSNHARWREPAREVSWHEHVDVHYDVHERFNGGHEHGHHR